MKKFIVLLSIIAISSFIKVEAQAILEHQYDSVYNFEGPFYTYTHGYVYATVDNYGHTIRLYDSQHNLLKSITQSISLYFVLNVSDHLFNSDDKLELFVSCSINNGSTIVLNEDNVILQTFNGQQPDFNYLYQINGNFKLKLYSELSFGINFFVYDLPGNTILDVSEGAVQSSKNIFPNPASTEIKINCPFESTSIVIYGMNGAEVYRKNVIGGKTEQVDVSSLSSGIYLYNVLSNNSVLATGKFQIKK